MIARTLIIIIFLGFIAIPISAQDSIQTKNIDNGLYFLPTQLLFGEIVLTFEHFTKKYFSISYSIGYKIPTGTGNVMEPVGSGLFATYEYQYMFNEFSKALYFSVAPSFYFKGQRKYYLQPELFYRFYWFDNKKLSFDNFETYRYNSIRTERIHVMGLKFLAGFNSMIKVSNRLVLNIKTYAGVGVRYKTYKYVDIDNEVPDDNGEITIIPYNEKTGDLILPSIHLGIKIGIAKTKTTVGY